MVIARTVAAALVIAVVALQAASATAQTKADRYYSKTYNTCMDAAGGSTLPMRDCINDEYTAWDKSLNQVYQALMASRPDVAKTQLRDDERAWLRRTKTKCDHAGDDDAGGTLQPVDIDLCNLDETVLRTVYLRGLH
jgi:uncharacterized protein YecT (DUF1311 family)